MVIILQTERLILRQFTLVDAPFILELLNSPNWLQFIGNREINTIADAQSYLLNGPLLNYVVQGFGLYVVELKETGQPTGMCGLVQRNYLEYSDIGYALLPQFEGRGYAYEVVLATLHYALTTLNKPGIAATTSQDNTRSIHLLKKLGFMSQGTVITDDQNELLLFVVKNRLV